MALALCFCLAGIVRSARAAGDPAQGPGGPILVVTAGRSTFGPYYAEILRTEGLNAFTVADITTLTANTLAAHDVVVLARMALTPAQANVLTDWVGAGGNLIAMAPDPALAGLLGITPAGPPLANGYLRVDTSTGPGHGIVNQTIQYHGSAQRYALNGAAALATLYSSASTATSHPAVTLRQAGLGLAAAFVYDLAESVVYTRQGNPAWATQERDGFGPIRSNDKFFGNAAGDVQPDWIDRSKLAIPQADEQQRLLANLILHMNASRKPLPRFWYLPNGKKAVIVMTGDDHGNGGTVGRFEQFRALSPAGCSVANWECVRGTSYIYASTPMSDAQAGQFTSEGFEVGLHVNTGCADFDRVSLQGFYDLQVPQFRARFPSAGPLMTQRHHCIAWSDWSSGAVVQQSHGMRLDTNYYHWPPSWVDNGPGLFTGSAMPMRFAQLDGSLIDVYMAATQMTDESGQTYPFTVNTLLDRALGPEGYYGAYTVNAHTDVANSPVADAVVSAAQARSVSIISAQQMLIWLDARNASSFGAIGFNASALSFTITKDPAANGLQAMLPTRSGTRLLSGITRAGSPVSLRVNTIKGVDYAFFAADAGAYVASYGIDSTGPAVTSTTPAAGAAGVSITSPVTITFGEAMTVASFDTSSFELRDADNLLVSATVSYDAATRTATLTPTRALNPSTSYAVTVRGGASGARVRDAAGNALATSVTWRFTTGTSTSSTALAAACPCSNWVSTTTPVRASVADPNPVEVGVKFMSDVSGLISGIRFYKGDGNSGTHIGNLWSTGGVLLASAPFTNEAASGWQQVNFASPVAITANAVYVASYFAPNGHYAGDNDYFAATGVDNGPIHLLRDGLSGGNGVYRYGSTSGFPVDTFRATNYWVDVVLMPNGASSDTTAPTLSALSPPQGSTGVPPGTSITATFSEAMTASTINTGTFELRNAANAVVAGSVTYDGATRTAIFTPASALSASTTFTAVVRGGAPATSVQDAAGLPLAASVSWSFTTASTPTPTSLCPCSAWSSASIPGIASVADPNPVELGVKFTADVAGLISGVRFYKGTGNTGTHIGSLWDANGVQLASATFSNETTSGWQQVNFATPVAISANTVYVASYFAPAGHYAGDNGFFATAGLDNGPIHLLRDGASGGNGVYRYGSTSGFPINTFQSSNYWVDVLFTPGGVSAPPVPVPTPSPGTGACALPANRIVAENCLAGNAPSEWDITGIGDPGIQGYATDISVNRGATVFFKVSTNATAYRFDIYRMGFYGGLGARKLATVTPAATLPQSQPACLSDTSTGLIDCGNWSVSGSWAVPAGAVSGIYFAKVIRSDTGGASHIFFIVRDDGGRSDLLFQTSDTTWQAYNAYGGNSFYTGAPAGRAYKVSYNRPFLTRAIDNGQDWVFNSEYPMVRWLEANGYDVSYFSGVDTDRRAGLLLDHRVFLSVGHDEYWSGAQRANVEAARNAGVNLAFFSGNEVFWKTRWEKSIDGSGAPYRTLVSYKETHADAKIDPTPVWTGTWRDPRLSPPADGGRPENALTGTLFMVNEGATAAIQVPAADGQMRFWRNTSVATLAAGGVATLADSTLGYEWDVDADNGFRPPGLIRLSTTSVANAPVLQDQGSTYLSGLATHSLTLYRHASGARVFGAGTVQWPWGLDTTHDRRGPVADPRMQQATVNLLADMNVQPGSLQADLVSASASTDGLAPTSVITLPAGGVTVGAAITLRGSASDSGGGVVAGMEVSVNDGATWRAASGRGSWTYNWTPAAAGAITIRSRAVDDSGNLETPGPGMSVNVGARVCPCTIWSPAAAPIVASSSDTAGVNLGVTLRVARNGFITGLRFYKGAGNTGTHVGTLWSRSGVALASATFTAESASGWQQVNFATPVAVTANTDYVASYHAPNGGYAIDTGYFTGAGVGTDPLQALADGVSGGNGVYAYGPTSAFPSASYRASNYWVDVVFKP